MSKLKLSPRALYAAVIAGVLVYALVGWFMLVSPKRAEAAELQRDVQTAETALAVARAAATRKDDTQPIAVADIFRVSKAMPSVPDMPGILLELARLAEESGIEFQSITPQTPVAAGTFQRIPIALTFDGNFYELSDFLFRLRTLVSVRSSELHATGRLFAVSTFSFQQSPSGFPELFAGLTVDAFVYGNGVPAVTAAPTAPPETPAPPADAGSEAAAEGTP
ncbi:MAG: type 4a pilus biogenesis protein PilO [Gaiellaceae bacterium]